MVDRYGFKMVGLRDTAQLTRGIENISSTGYHIDIYYNTKTGRVWGLEHVGNTYTSYDDEDIFYCGTAKTTKTMQNIADIVAFNMRDSQ